MQGPLQYVDDVGPADPAATEHGECGFLPDVYTYPGTEVLRNKQGIDDPELAHSLVDTGTTNTNLAHCRPEYIEGQALSVFTRIQKDGYLRELNLADLADRLAFHWGELTALHPFRDGNTRSQRAFVDQLVREAGWAMNWHRVNAEMGAFIQARLLAHGGDHAPLRFLLHNCLAPATPSHIPAQSGMEGPPLSDQLRWLTQARPGDVGGSDVGD